MWPPTRIRTRVSKPKRRTSDKRKEYERPAGDTPADEYCISRHIAGKRELGGVATLNKESEPATARG